MVMADQRRSSALHTMYKLQDQVTSLLRSTGVAVIDVRVDEARRQVVIELDPANVDDVNRVLRHLPADLLNLRVRRVPTDPPA